MSIPAEPTIVDVYRICTEQSGKDFEDLRDRAAYVDLVGALPTHLRPGFTRALSLISWLPRESAGGRKKSFPFKVKDDARKLLRLEEHPMIRKARQLEEAGYEIPRPDLKRKRNGYGRVFMRRGDNWIIVKSDGSTLEPRLLKHEG
ncbi:hypothetical protein [Erythrobacter sp.]|uniref:hypothetical protein n=1 Tax=Erythrobacter sp. TaxID=1042 RepID=UPI001425CBC2|nr:hypothetical protein [Erythrobacter sp.]QIQ87814.1 MAG: hypothetical protein G9473_14805 [Erythrobacter sp.]